MKKVINYQFVLYIIDLVNDLSRIQSQYLRNDHLTDNIINHDYKKLIDSHIDKKVISRIADLKLELTIIRTRLNINLKEFNKLQTLALNRSLEKEDIALVIKNYKYLTHKNIEIWKTI